MEQNDGKLFIIGYLIEAAVLVAVSCCDHNVTDTIVNPLYYKVSDFRGFVGIAAIRVRDTDAATQLNGRFLFVCY